MKIEGAKHSGEKQICCRMANTIVGTPIFLPSFGCSLN